MKRLFNQGFISVPLLLCTTLSVWTMGCTAVSREAYDRDLAAMKTQQDLLESQKKATSEQLTDREAKLKQCLDVGQGCQREKQALQEELTSTKKALDACTTNRGQGAKELASCQIERDKLQTDSRGKDAALRQAQENYKVLQDKLAKVEASIGQVRQRLQKLVDSGKLRVVLKNGFLVIEMQSDILFDTGKADLKAAAKPVLQELAAVLQTMADRRFQVAGHTDNTGTAQLNWRLSVQRALAVVEELVADGVQPASLSAGGYGPYVPVAANDSDDNKQRNRRVEFLLLPDLSDLLNLSK